jgi:5-methyltetrahydrofolate--homocysteine methyltransferase
VGAEAERLYREAREMLNTIIKDRLLTATGIVGFYPANSIGQTYLLVKTRTVLHFLVQIQICQLEATIERSLLPSTCKRAG